MPDYCFDPARLRLIVHILAPGAGGEFTFLRTFSRRRPRDLMLHPSPIGPPANCLACWKAVKDIREAIRGVRWSIHTESEETHESDPSKESR